MFRSRGNWKNTGTFFSNAAAASNPLVAPWAAGGNSHGHLSIRKKIIHTRRQTDRQDPSCDLAATPGRTAQRTIVEWNIEIMFMFAISGVIYYNTLSLFGYFHFYVACIITLSLKSMCAKTIFVSSL